MRSPVIRLILLCLVVYLINGRPHAEVDCVAAPYTAWSIIRHGSLELQYYPELKPYVGGAIVKLESGSWVSMRPPGSAIAAIPFVLPVALARENPASGSTMLQLGKLAAAVSVAAAAALFFLVCRRLAPKAAWPAALLLALGTCLCSVASQALWMHGPATFWLCCALYFLTRESQALEQNAAWAGFALGMAVLARPSTAFFAMATLPVFLMQRRWKTAAGLIAGGLLPFAVLCLINWIQFGNLLKGGYTHDDWNASPPFWLGLSGLLVAPSRGLFVYSPALLLLPVGIMRLFRNRNGLRSESEWLLMAWLFATGLTLLFYSRWHDWRGGWCYGPRYFCETMPALCLVFALGYEKLQATWSRGIAWSLIGLSIMVHLVGIFGYGGYADWQIRHDLPDQGRCLFELRDTQIEAHARAVVRKFTGN